MACWQQHLSYSTNSEEPRIKEALGILWDATISQVYTLAFTKCYIFVKVDIAMTIREGNCFVRHIWRTEGGVSALSTFPSWFVLLSQVEWCSIEVLCLPGLKDTVSVMSAFTLSDLNTYMDGWIDREWVVSEQMSGWMGRWEDVWVSGLVSKWAEWVGEK